MFVFSFLKILAALASPPASLALAVVVALLLRWARWRRLASAVLTLGIAQTLILSFPPLADLLMGHLEAQERAAERRAPACCYDAIVVLGGVISPAYPPERPEPDLHEHADRMWQAARLLRRGVAPRIIVSGGSFLAARGGPPTTEAEAMRVFLLDLGVPANAITDEGKALNTIENIRNVRAIVGSGRVALVTSAFHMPRALQIAARAGLEVGAFPTDYSGSPAHRTWWENWLPSLGALYASNVALREIVALNFDFRRGSPEP
jgi:uncharacterized SAM-binding protein YcdF (DUF218 family)